MPLPTLLTRIKHTIGRAIRETGQAIDRVGIRGQVHVKQSRTQLGDDSYKFQDHLSRHRNLMPLLKRGRPVLHDNVAFIAPCSSLIGTVRVGEGSSIWYGSVLRADQCDMGLETFSEEEIEEWKNLDQEERVSYDTVSKGGGIFIGKGSNIQDGCVISSSVDHTRIGDGVTVGHCAAINSATVGDNSLIGMGAILNPGSKVEGLAFVAAGAVIGKGEVVKKGELWVGNPARKLRDMSKEEMDQLHVHAEEYVKNALGQNHVMELGGNIPESLVQYLTIEGGDTNNISEDENQK